jgi:Fe2+ or Zn2+ uptake regulation protein
MNDIEKLKQQTKLIRKKRYYTSKLTPNRKKLSLMHSQGATIAELQRWLKAKHIEVNYSTVYRFIKR